MLVKLLKHIEEGNGIKLVKRRGRADVAFVQGAVIEVSDATGQKYIERGDAVKVDSGPVTVTAGTSTGEVTVTGETHS